MRYDFFAVKALYGIIKSSKREREICPAKMVMRDAEDYENILKTIRQKDYFSVHCIFKPALGFFSRMFFLPDSYKILN